MSCSHESLYFLQLQLIVVFPRKREVFGELHSFSIMYLSLFPPSPSSLSLQSSAQSEQSSNVVKQPSPTNSILLPSTSSPSSNPRNSSPDSGIAIGSQSFCSSGDSVSPPAHGPADSTSLFPPSSSGPQLIASPRKQVRGGSLPQLNSRINPVLVSGQASSLTPPHNTTNMMAPYNPAEMSGPYYQTRRSQQQPSTQFPLNHVPSNYQSGPPPYAAYPPPYGSGTASLMTGQSYPPTYNSLPSYYNHSSNTVSAGGYPATDSSYLAYPDPQPQTPATMLPPPSTCPAYTNNAQTENSVFNSAYSTAMSSPCSSTHSEAITTHIDNTFKEFVTSVAMTTSPTTSPHTVGQLSPQMETQPQSMEVECLKVSEEAGRTGVRLGEVDRQELESTEQALDQQNMTERCVCVCMCVFLYNVSFLNSGLCIVGSSKRQKVLFW